MRLAETEWAAELLKGQIRRVAGGYHLASRHADQLTGLIAPHLIEQARSINGAIARLLDSYVADLKGGQLSLGDEISPRDETYPLFEQPAEQAMSIAPPPLPPERKEPDEIAAERAPRLFEGDDDEPMTWETPGYLEVIATDGKLKKSYVARYIPSGEGPIPESEVDGAVRGPRAQLFLIDEDGTVQVFVADDVIEELSGPEAWADWAVSYVQAVEKHNAKLKSGSGRKKGQRNSDAPSAGQRQPVEVDLVDPHAGV